jgi:hypothetical protein
MIFKVKRPGQRTGFPIKEVSDTMGVSHVSKPLKRPNALKHEVSCELQQTW